MAERAAKQLELNKSELPNSITEVIATLSRAGFDAYIVGGGVRDTLLGLKPKDFDAVTDAKPHEIKDVFGKRCRIIGRRFQLAHVYSGRELIEVATFRGPPTNDANTNQDGMIIRDNVWGDIKQDFSRRDFSINALYYQPLKGVVHDFCGALDDIRSKTIRLLGQASVRIEEDPVRLLRALRFKAKLGFEFDKELSEQFHDGNWARLEQISPHRLYDETQKMFTGGYLVPLLPLLFESGAIDSLIVYPPSEPSSLVRQVAINTDKRIAAGKSINPAFFYAALLWENYLHQLEKAKNRNMPFADAQMQAACKVIDRQRIKTAIPKFAEQFIRDIWLLQPKLAAPRSRQIEQLAEHPRFRAGFDFLLLREQCGDAEHPLSESTNGMGDWWQTYQTLSENQQQQAIDDFDENIRRGSYKRDKNGQRGRGRNRQKEQMTDNNEQVAQKENSAQASSNGRVEQSVVNDPSNIPARRRRAADKSVVSESQNQTQAQAKQPTAVKARNGRNGQSSNKRSPQAKHDSNELAQLQQLSLNNSNTTAEHRHVVDKAQPAPLFVIEHENVVPPLKKHLAEHKTTDKVTQTEKNKAPTQKKPSTQHDRVNADANGSSRDQRDHVKSDKGEQNKTKASEPKSTSQSAAAKSSPTRTVAQSPKLVTMDNEPIPYKRRRRQVSSETKAVDAKSSATANYSAKEPEAADKFEVKAATHKKATNEKVVKKTESTELAKTTKADKSNKVAKPSKAQVDVQKVAKGNDSEEGNSEQSTNKGPVPAKRRRRQPSTDTATS